MPNLWKFLTKAETDAPKIDLYEFAEADELIPEPEEFPSPAGEESLPEREDPAPAQPQDPVSFAQVQSERLLSDASRRAEEIIRQAEDQAAQAIREARELAREEGYRAGFQEGLRQGTAQALEEGRQAREAQAEKLEEAVAAFLARADRVLAKQMDDNLDDLRDLALAVAEKVVCVSLKSSSDVIGRMIQTAVDKRKRRDWVHIYIAECDAKRMTSIPASLTAALTELSGRVRIIPMSDDEAGTCIIECPDEIIDASVATQMQNIRELLANGPSAGVVTAFNLNER